MTILLATHNQNKVEEIKNLIPKYITLKSLRDIDYHEEIEETGVTLEENSKIKAETIFQKTGITSIADDTGLEVYALDYEPGVYSARYAGSQKSDAQNMEKLLHKLELESDRRARFRTVFTLRTVHETLQFEGIVEGQITREKAGEFGFGYDPVFIPEDKSLTFAQMTMEDKNKISHRARALSKLVAYLTSQNML